MRRLKDYATLGGVVLAVAGLGALTACEDPTGAQLFNDKPALEVKTEVAVVGTPTGSYLNQFEVVDLDTASSPQDLFDRSAQIEEQWHLFGDQIFEVGTSYGGKSYWAPRWYKPDEFGGLRDDPRKPLLPLNELVADEYPSAMDFIRFYSPASIDGLSWASCPDGPCWWIRHDVDVMAPNGTWLAEGLVRYATRVNGIPDHLEVWVEGEVVEPDSLVPMPWSPGGYPDHQADWWQFRVPAGEDPCPPVPAGANPFILGNLWADDGSGAVGTDGGANYDGEIDADYCFSSAGQWGEGGLTDGTQPIAPNEFESFDLPRYNYIVFWGFDKAQGGFDAIDYSTPWLRAQVGVDIDMDGNPIPHAYAPFPFFAGHNWSQHFASREAFFADERVAAGASSSEITVRNLPSFSGLEYRVVLHNQATDAYQEIPVTWVQQRPDTVGTDELGDPIIEFVNVGQPAQVESFSSQGQAMRHVIDLERQTLADGGFPMKDFSHVIVYLVPQGQAVDPERSAAVFSFQYVDLGGTPDFRFDDITAKSGEPLFAFLPGKFAAAGKSWAAFGGGDITFSGEEEFGLVLNRIARPPAGWFYEVWGLQEAEDGSVTREVSFGEITTPEPMFESLLDADVTTGEWVTETEILRAAKHVDFSQFSGAASANEFTRIAVTMEPKDGTSERSPIQIFTTAVPPDLASLAEAQE